MKVYLIVNGAECEHDEHKKAYNDDKRFTAEGMEDFVKYTKKHQEHFTDELAKWASNRMVNAHGDPDHHWSVEQVKDAFEKLGLKKPDDVTWGDAMYLANMHYADYFGESLKTEIECIKQAYADIIDPDGYPEKAFSHWYTDVLKKNVDVPWELFY